MLYSSDLEKLFSYALTVTNIYKYILVLDLKIYLMVVYLKNKISSGFADPLNFKALKTYKERFNDARQKTAWMTVFLLVSDK